MKVNDAVRENAPLCIYAVLMFALVYVNLRIFECV
jgi:hypothetical protein